MSQLLAIQLLTILISLACGFSLAWFALERRISRAQYERQCARQVAVRAGCEAREKDERLSSIERSQVEILRAIREQNKALCISEPPKPTTYFTYSDLEVSK